MHIDNALTLASFQVIENEKQRLRDLREKCVVAAIEWSKLSGYNGATVITMARMFFEYVENGKEGNE